MFTPSGWVWRHRANQDEAITGTTDVQVGK